MTNQLELPKNQAPVIMALTSLTVGIIGASFAAVFIKWSEYQVSPNATTFNRLWIAALVLLLWNGFKSIGTSKQPVEQESLTSQDWWLLLGFGTLFAISQCLWAWSLTQTNVAISSILHNLTPLSTSVGAWLLFGQRFDRKFIVGMLIAIGAVTAIGLADVQIATGKIQGDLAALLSAIVIGINLLIAEQLRTKLSATTVLMWGSLIAAVVMLPFVLFSERLFPSDWSGRLSVIGLALICHVFGQGLITHSLNKVSSAIVAILFLFDPVLSSIEAWAVFSEGLNFSDGIAFAGVLLGIYLAVSSQSTIID